MNGVPTTSQPAAAQKDEAPRAEEAAPSESHAETKTETTSTKTEPQSAAETKTEPLSGAKPPLEVEPESETVPREAKTAAGVDESMTALSGEYRYIGGSAQREGISKAIESVTDSMSRLVREIARKRLEKSNRAPQKISIRRDGEDITVTLDGDTYRGRPGGPPVRVKNSEGGMSTMRLKIQKGRLYQTFVADEGQRTNVFAPYAEGRKMNLWVTVRSGRLPGPVKYRLTYTE